MRDITILHLSDLHFRTKEKEGDQAFRRDIGRQMLAGIKEHLQRVNHELDFVAITGDIAFDGKDYSEAKNFLADLRTIVPDTAVFLPVPGNHDVNRDETDDFSSLYPVVQKEEVDQFLEKPRNIERYVNVKFTSYYEFAAELNNALYVSPQKLFWVQDFAEQEVSFIGLNSSWACQGDNDRSRIALGPAQVRQALEQSGLKNKIILMHHPLYEWFHEGDRGACQPLIFQNCRLVLHGHTHIHDAEYHGFPGSGTICLCANASYTKNNDGYIGFQFLQVSFAEELQVRVWPYRYNELNGRIIPDRNRWGEFQQGREYVDLTPVALNSAPFIKSSKSPAEVLRDYRNWFNEFHSPVYFAQLAKNGEALPVQLLEIYIPLETQSPFYKPETETEKAAQRKKSSRGKADREVAVMSEPAEPPMIDIESLIARTHNLLLRGNAGTGKTTLVKHLVNTILQDSCPDPLRGYLPVLVFCKDLWQVYRENGHNGKKITDGGELLDRYLAKSQCGLTWEMTVSYLEKHKAILFFDGLDEAPAAWRDELVDLIATLRLKYPGNRFILTGRPHGVEGRAVEKFGSSLRDIAPLNEQLVAEYIRKWFRAVSGQAQGMANVNAEDMLADIHGHEHIAVFTQNPLLLAAVCVLYLSGKRIPEQRADLYDRIVENLLWRRFHDALEPERETQVEAYLMKLAFWMQDQGRRTIEEDEAKAVLRAVFPKPDTISDEMYYLQIDRRFGEIEPDCGLLNRLSDGKLEFFHLTFQEFLAAKYLANRNLPCKPYLDNPWWEEAVILYLGLGNLTWQKLSNDIIIDDIFNGPEGEEPRRILMGAKALRDFQASRREPEAVKTVRTKLMGLIDSGFPLKVRYEAGELLGAIGDPRLPTLEEDKLIRVPAGEFLCGSEEYDDEKPVLGIYLTEYFIGRYPLTNGEFKRFLDDKGYENEDYWSPEGWQWRERDAIIGPEYWHDRVWNGPNYPVVGVSWYEAEAYCRWLSAKTRKNYRLPTEAEWEKAARGTDGRRYPWGNEWDDQRCNSFESGLGRTSPAGIFLEGESPFGCMDMAGNVLEWCGDWYDEKHYSESKKRGVVENPSGPATGSRRVLRGGSWGSDAQFCRCAGRSYLNPGLRFNFVGFRLVFVP